jgi:hypothetical protein
VQNREFATLVRFAADGFVAEFYIRRPGIKSHSLVQKTHLVSTLKLPPLTCSESLQCQFATLFTNGNEKPQW